MAVTQTDINIYNACLARLGRDPITSFDDGSPAADLGKSQYEIIRDAEASRYIYAFNKQQTTLSLETELDPARNHWRFKWFMPDDMLSSGPRAVVTAGGILARNEVAFDVVGGRILTNNNNVDAVYPRRVDASEFSDLFKRALILVLAEEFCLALTESERKLAVITNQLRGPGGLYNDMVASEALNKPGGGFTANPLLDARNSAFSFDPVLEGY